MEVKLHGVLFIPTYPQWIFSVRAATEREAIVVFKNDSAMIIAPNGQRFPVCMRDKLYYLYKSEVASSRAETLETWHALLSHCNADDILKLSECVIGMTVTN